MSTKVVPADIDINQEIAKKAIFEQFGITVKSISILGEGWDNLVYLVNDDLVFRFPRRKVALPLLQREMHVLQVLASKVTLAVPDPIFTCNGCASFPYFFYGHKLIEGKTGCSLALSNSEFKNAAHDFGIFLKTLHELNPVDFYTADDKMTPVFDRADSKKMIKTFQDRLQATRLKTNLNRYNEKIEAIVQNANFYRPEKSKACFVHGDLYHRHLLFDESNKLTGVIDWGDCCVSDPAVDFAVLFQFFPKNVHSVFWNAYQKPVTVEQKSHACFLGLYYAIALLWYGLDRGDQNLVSTSLKTLENI